MLSIEVEFLTGRYGATIAIHPLDGGIEAEWPPHPARLFWALAATHFETAGTTEIPERSALEWLADQGAPEIAASEAQRRDIAAVYVPVNDVSVIASLTDEDAEVEAARDAVARASGDKALAAAKKRLDKAEGRFAEALKRATAAVAPAKGRGEETPRLPAPLEQRLRQPRTFPSVRPDDPRVAFTWPAAAPTDEQRALLDGLLGRMVRLGHSSSLVTARIGDGERPATWLPETKPGRNGNDSIDLRVVDSGQVASLVELYQRAADEPGRVMPTSFARYVRPRGDRGARVEPPPVFADDWEVLARVSGAYLPSTAAVGLARTLRKALLQAHGPGAPELLSGHRTDGTASHRAHLAFVPLPFVGSKHADGTIKGVALVFPREATAEERRAVFGALHAWQARAREQDAGSDDEDEPTLPIFLGRDGEMRLARHQPLLRYTAALDPSTWCRPRHRWVSATPVALDQNPGDLRDKDPRKAASAFAAAEKIIRLACTRIGLPQPARVTVSPAALLTGSEKVRRFPAFLQGSPPVQRVLLHASLEFEHAVAGPVLLGAGRYYGLGLFRPVVE